MHQNNGSAPPWLLSVLAILLGMACHPVESASHLNATLSREDDHWKQREIHVCFEQTERSYEIDRQTIARAVQSEYARAGIQFVGWASCREADSGIRVSFSETADRSHTVAFGRNNAGITANLVIGLQSRCPVIFSGSVCERNAALHEFGHALGLRHEMNRRDNMSCSLDQTAGEGEAEALQIGAYDGQSLMDYCQLYAATDRQTVVQLSEGDLSAIRARYFGLVASLNTDVPPLVSSPWSGLVQGENLSSYRYAVGPQESLACEDLSSYSEVLPLHQPLQIDPERLGEDPSIFYRLCLLGEDASGRRQNLGDYSSFTFRVISAEVLARSHGHRPILRSPPRLFQTQLHGTSVVILEIDVGHGVPLASYSATLVYTDPSLVQSVSHDRWKPHERGEGRYHIIFSAEQFPANGDVYLGSLAMTDILGQRSSLYSKASGTHLNDSPWLSPALRVDWAFEHDGQGPELQEIRAFPRRLSAGQSAVFELQIHENSAISRMSLTLSSQHGSLPIPVTWIRREGDFYQLTMHIPQRLVNGIYQISSVSLEDVTGNLRLYTLDEASHRLSHCKLEAPYLELDGGLDFEQNPPLLQHIRWSETRVTAKQTIFIDLNIADESGIKEVRLNFAHRSDRSGLPMIYGLDRGEIAGLRRMELNFSDQQPLGEYLVQELTIVDRFGSSKSYQPDARGEFFVDSFIPVPKIELLAP